MGVGECEAYGEHNVSVQEHTVGVRECAGGAYVAWQPSKRERATVLLSYILVHRNLDLFHLCDSEGQEPAPFTFYASNAKANSRLGLGQEPAAQTHVKLAVVAMRPT